MDIQKWIDCVKKDREKYINWLDNMERKEVPILRNELAEQGIEMTPSEISDLLELFREILLDE